MIDPRREAVLIRNGTDEFDDRTSSVSRYEIRKASDRIAITFNSGKTYRQERVVSDLLHKAGALYARLRRLQEVERTRARLSEELAAHRLELEHFQRHIRHDALPELAGLPLLRRSADHILGYLAESELERTGVRPGLVRRLCNYFRYRALRGLDPDDTTVVLRLQRAYYDKRIAELDQRLRQADAELDRANFDDLTLEHQRLSTDALRAELGSRYESHSGRTYREETYPLGNEFSAFVADYPVLLSTGHALRDSIATIICSTTSSSTRHRRSIC